MERRTLARAGRIDSMVVVVSATNDKGCSAEGTVTDGVGGTTAATFFPKTRADIAPCLQLNLGFSAPHHRALPSCVCRQHPSPGHVSSHRSALPIALYCTGVAEHASASPQLLVPLHVLHRLVWLMIDAHSAVATPLKTALPASSPLSPWMRAFPIACDITRCF